MISVYDDNSFYIHDKIECINNTHQLGFTTRFIIPSDKEIIISDNFVDICGINSKLRLDKSNLLNVGIHIEECEVSRLFNTKSSAKCLILTSHSRLLDIKLNFRWVE